MSEYDKLTLIGFLAGCLHRAEKKIGLLTAHGQDGARRACEIHKRNIERELSVILADVK